MLILGLDPGTATTGYGLVHEAADGSLAAVDFGVITTAAKVPMPKRLLQLHTELRRLLERFQPDEVAIEQLFFGKAATTGITVAQARGVLLLACAQHSLPIAEYKPLTVKQSLVGYGGAEKLQMQIMVQQLLNLDALPRPDDAADGLAIAIAHLNATRMQRML
ncbi:MAG: crossover junction endodeoxyribonuclease RuvC [Anaerolineae bacterium]|nr:crossover junction endodeoxyribonuclease RuvC [Anaerolineae bacterium]